MYPAEYPERMSALGAHRGICVDAWMPAINPRGQLGILPAHIMDLTCTVRCMPSKPRSHRRGRKSMYAYRTHTPHPACACARVGGGDSGRAGPLLLNECGARRPAGSAAARSVNSIAFVRRVRPGLAVDSTYLLGGLPPCGWRLGRLPEVDGAPR